MGIIYLIQPKELIGTNRYKIGCSTKLNCDRIKRGYKKGTNIILIYKCIDPFVIEREIIAKFNSKFKLIAGNEYYSGDIKEMTILFIEIINKYNIEKINVIDNKIILEPPENIYKHETKCIKHETKCINHETKCRNYKKKCMNCKQEFKYPSYLKRHINSKHECKSYYDMCAKDDTKAQCKFCGKFLRKTNLKRHQSTACKKMSSNSKSNKIIHNNINSNNTIIDNSVDNSINNINVTKIKIYPCKNVSLTLNEDNIDYDNLVVSLKK